MITAEESNWPVANGISMRGWGLNPLHKYCRLTIFELNKNFIQPFAYNLLEKKMLILKGIFVKFFLGKTPSDCKEYLSLTLAVAILLLKAFYP